MHLKSQDIEPVIEYVSTEDKLNFKKYDLVDVIGKIGDVDCSIRIYPSIQFALNGEEFRQFVEKANERFKYADEDDGFDEEEIDEFDE